MSLPSRDHASLGKYRVIAELGHGGMADVYLAVMRGPVGFNKLMVIKQLRAHLTEVPDFLDMFLDEARLAARLNHPNVVQTNEVVEEGNRYFIAMEYLDGQPFDRVLRRAQKDVKENIPPRLTLGHQLRVLCDVLEGLHYAHELTDFDGSPLQVVHRDVSPHNVFITYEGQVKVVDFGIAKAANCSAETRTGVLKGKIAYMAPEQARGDAVDRRADVFAVGLMLWEAITGERTWKGLTDIQILSRLATAQIPAPSSVRTGIPIELERICLRAIAYEAHHRYPSAAHMREDLERAIEYLGLRASPREVGAVVGDMFRDRRAEIRALIDTQLRDARSMPTGEYQAATPVSLINLNATASLSSVTNIPSLPPIPGDDDDQQSSPSQHSRAQPRAVTASVIPPPAGPPAGKKLPVALLASVGAGALLLGVVGVAATRSPATQPVATTSTQPAADTAAGLCEVKIQAAPYGARLFLDDAPLPANPYASRFPRDGAMHRVRVEAPGYDTRSELIAFNQPSVALDVRLVATAPDATADKTAPAGNGRAPSGRSAPAARPATPATAAAPATAAPPAEPAEPAAPPPRVKKGDKRPLDGDDPWAK